MSLDLSGSAASVVTLLSTALFLAMLPLFTTLPYTSLSSLHQKTQSLYKRQHVFQVVHTLSAPHTFNQLSVLAYFAFHVEDQPEAKIRQFCMRGEPTLWVLVIVTSSASFFR